VTAAVDLARASVLTTGKSRYDFLLDSLFGSAFSSEAPTTIEVSSFLSLFSPCSLRVVLDRHGRYLRYASSVSLSSSSSSSLSSSLSLSLSIDEHFRRTTSELYNHCYANVERTDDISELDEDAGGDYGGAADELEEVIPQGGASFSSRPRVARGSSLRSIAMIVPRPELGGEGGGGGGHSLSFTTFAIEAMKRSQCLESFKVGEQHRFVIALIDYDLDQLLRTNGPPVLTEVFVNGSGVTVNCPCSGSYLAALATENDVKGIEGKDCFHAQLVKLPGALDLLTQNPISVCDRRTRGITLRQLSN